jgi:hypothetical protein
MPPANKKKKAGQLNQAGRIPDDKDENIIISAKKLQEIVDKSNGHCKNCKNSLKVDIFSVEILVKNISLVCKKCETREKICTSKKSERNYDLNVQAVGSMMAAGMTISSLERFLLGLNIFFPYNHQTIYSIKNEIAPKVDIFSKNCMRRISENTPCPWDRLSNFASTKTKILTKKITFPLRGTITTITQGRTKLVIKIAFQHVATSGQKMREGNILHA